MGEQSPMRPLAELTHYEILDLSSGVTAFDIRQAYKAALELYSEDSLAIYSLFSSDERKEILARVDEAFATLMDEQSRYAYDQMLIQKGLLQGGSQQRELREKPPSVGSPGSMGTAPQTKTEKPPAAENPVVKEILSQEVLTGMDLKRLRTELGVSVEQIAEWTKIRPGFLRCIEEDQFNEFPSRFHLRGFLKAYVQYLHLDPEPVVNRYMRRIEI
jgi:curved DNA-binding protein CbpA